MSVATEIDRIKQNIENAYSAIAERGGTLPDVQNSANLADAINSVKGKITLNASPSSFSLVGTGRSLSINLYRTPTTIPGNFRVKSYDSSLLYVNLSGSTLRIETRSGFVGSHNTLIDVIFSPTDSAYYATPQLTIRGTVSAT